MNLVSVIIPAYNCANTIVKCLQSIKMQTWTNWEAIIVNDGSTDDTENVIKQFIQNEERFTLLNQLNNGSPVAKNNGLAYSKGDFIQFLDADDFLSNDKLENQVKYLQENKNDLIWCSTFKYKNNKLNKIDKVDLYQIQNPLEFLLCLNGIQGNIGMIQPNAYMFSRLLLDKSGTWNTLLKYSPDDDSEFFSRVILQANRIVYDDKSINFYREPTDKSLSKRISEEAAKGAIKSVELKFQNILNRAPSEATLDLYAYHLSILAYQYGRYHKVVLNSILYILHGINRTLNKKVGGKKFQFMVFFLGFNRTLYLLRLINRFIF